MFNKQWISDETLTLRVRKVRSRFVEKSSHFILDKVFLASFSILASMVIPSRSMRSIAAAKFSFDLSVRAWVSRPSTSLQYFSHTKYLLPFVMTSSLTKFSLASSIAFWRAPRSIFSPAIRSYRALSLSLRRDIISRYLLRSVITVDILSLNSVRPCSS